MFTHGITKSNIRFLHAALSSPLCFLQMHFVSAVSCLLMFSLALPGYAGKCPKVCSCDDAKLTVACVGKNLTEVPKTVDEVGSSTVSLCRGWVKGEEEFDDPWISRRFIVGVT